MRRLLFWAVLLVVGMIPAAQLTQAQASLPLDEIKLPAGFKIAVYASNVPDARSMTLGDKGTLFVGSWQAGNVYAITGDASGTQVHVIASGLNQPNGVAFRNGSLFVATISQIMRYDNIEDNIDNPPQPVVVKAGFPSDNLHQWRFIKFGPDGLLYVPVGAPCNICQANWNVYGTIMRMAPDGTGLTVFASGLRNTVGFDWQPDTGALWFTDNGVDTMGDNIPGDELNEAPQAGMNFGFPYCHAGTIADPQYGAGHPCSQYTPPMQVLGPHVAALGMRFYTGSMFPAQLKGQIFIAEHGSESRSVPIGYRVTVVTLTNGKPTSYDTFADGWLQGNTAWGRPVDVQQMTDGSLLISDDKANAIYRVTYGQ